MPTYTPLQSIVLTSATASVVFSNINQNYQDLILVQNTSTSSSGNIYLRYNEDSTSSYSNTVLNATSSSINSGRNSAISKGFIDSDAYAQNNFKYNAVTHIMNYSNTTTFKTALTKASNTGIGFTANIMTYIKTSAISRIEVFANVGNLQAGSTFDLYAISPASANTAQASGGTEIIYTDTHVIHVFKASGTFTPTRNLTADYLVVAGGGGNAAFYGGGAGGYRTSVGSGQGSPLSLTSGTSYTVTVGAGGAGGTGNSNGSDSVFSTITSTGGGKGTDATGGNGGSGGAGLNVIGTGNTPSTSPSQGNNGGLGRINGSNPNYFVGAGGGGAGGVGGSGVGTTVGNGGVGAFNNITGTSIEYAGGGAGRNATNSGIFTGSSGTASGGGGTDDSGDANTGGGSGGGGYPTAGGSGIVIVRYAR